VNDFSGVLVFSASGWLITRQAVDAQLSIKRNKHELYTSGFQQFKV
jgi:hypothetical protein